MIHDLKPYKEYKDSGLPWLGQVPAHWNIRRMKLLLQEIDARSTSGKEQLLKVSQYTGVTQRKIADGGDAPDTRASSLVGYKRVKPHDLVINIMLAWNGSLGVSRYDGIASPAYCVYRFKAGANPWYYHELLRMPLYKGRIKTASTGVVESRLRLYSDDLGRLEAIQPPPDEQAAIVRFLDWANGRLERAIRAKRKVITLLGEQKQAIIHHAVTRGIDPNVRLSTCDSRWFPALPLHWEGVTMRRVINAAIDGPHFSPQYLDNGVPFLSARNIRTDRWILENAKFISEQNYVDFCRRVRPEAGDVLYTKGGTTGVARVVDLTFRFQVWVHIAVLKVRKDRISPEYLAYCLNSPRCYEQSQLYTRGATNQDLGLGRMKGIELPLPPTLVEQQKIVEYLDIRCSSLNHTISKLEREIELLREYRTRLVADVVTGKLDVRRAAKTLPDEPLPDTIIDEADLAEDLDTEDEEASA